MQFLQSANLSNLASQFMLPIGVMIIFFLFFIQPQLKRQKKEKAFREGLKKGDRVITISGVHGKILSVEDNTILVEVDDNVKIRYERSAIRDYATPTTPQKA